MKNFAAFLLLFFFVSFAQSISAQKPYALKAGTDITLGAGIIMVGSASQIVHKKDTLFTVATIETFKIEDIPRFDRSATSRWSVPLSHVSDVCLFLSVASPLALFASQSVRNDAATHGVMVAENYFATIAITNLTKTLIRRPRPYVYNSDVPIHLKLKKDARRSFFSGHTSLAFASAVYASTVFANLHPNSQLRPWVWATTLTLATTTGVLRYASGKHFPSDIFAGAAVGSLFGFAVPRLHQVKDKSMQRKQAFTVTVILPLSY